MTLSNVRVGLSIAIREYETVESHDMEEVKIAADSAAIMKQLTEQSILECGTRNSCMRFRGSTV